MQASGLGTCDFLHVDTLLLRRSLRRIDVFVVMEIGTHQVHILDVTTRPDARAGYAEAGNLLMDLQDRARRFAFLIRDRDATFTPTFDMAFSASGVRIITTPIQAPRATPTRSGSSAPCAESA